MAEILPVNFDIPSENIVASYDYTDIAEGTGIVKLNAFASNSSAGLAYHLGKNVVYSSLIDTGWSQNNVADFTKVGDLDFDLSAFNYPTVLRGTATINMTLSVYNVDAAKTSSAYVIAKIRKYSGLTETDIVSVQSETISVTTTLTTKTILCLKATVPKTAYKRGDILRLTIEVWGKIPDGGTNCIMIGLDPMNRDGEDTATHFTTAKITPSTDNKITQLNFYCPFRIDS